MIILGIDPGFATIGYGVVEQTKTGLVPVDFGVITTPTTEIFPVRLAMIDEAMNSLMDKFKPNVVSVEELFFNTNITTGIKVAHARGIIIASAIKTCGLIYEYTPLQIKQALTSNGRAAKNQVQYMVKHILKLQSIPKPDDAADALAAAICHANTLNKREAL